MTKRAWVESIDAYLGVTQWNGLGSLKAKVNEFTWTHDADVAIYKLASPVTLNDYIRPVRLPTKSQTYDNFIGQEGYISGWGGFPSSLMYITVKFVKSHGIFAARGYPDTSLGIIGGDSGSPVFIYEGGIPTQVAVATIGWSGPTTGGPYVAEQLDWIKNVTGIPIRTYST